jgi:hypothetical protein
MADLNAGGELKSRGEYRYDLLQQIPGAPDLIGRLSGLLWRSPDEFEEAINPGSSKLVFRWKASSPSAGMATLRFQDTLVSITVLLSGLSEDQDHLTVLALQQHLLRELRDTGFEPAFGLMDLKERPVAATINFHAELNSSDQFVSALADRCFAAAYFRYQSLA